MENERFPRTLSEAFGPHTSNRIEPAPLTPAEIASRELTWAGIACAAVGIVGMLVVWAAS